MKIIQQLTFLALIVLSFKGTTQTQELPRATFEEAGLNRDSIENLINRIYETRHKDFRGLVVIKDNKLVIEEHFNTYMWNTIHDIRSAGKSVTTLLLGIALKEGLIESLDVSIYSLFSEVKNPRINKDLKNVMLRDVLNMSSQLDADSDDGDTYGHAGNWISLSNWKEYILNVPISSQKDRGFVYADINPLLVGLAIEEASGMSLRDYAQEKLFDPLGINQVYWFTNESNQTGAAGNLYLTTLDFAKLGVIVANDGIWNDLQIVEADYIETLLKTNISMPEGWPADSYGMFWYKSSHTLGERKLDYLYASGLGGNHLVVVPEEKLVIAVTSSAYGQPYQHGRSFAIEGIILDALK